MTDRLVVKTDKQVEKTGHTVDGISAAQNGKHSKFLPHPFVLTCSI